MRMKSQYQDLPQCQILLLFAQVFIAMSRCKEKDLSKLKLKRLEEARKDALGNPFLHLSVNETYLLKILYFTS